MSKQNIKYQIIYVTVTSHHIISHVVLGTSLVGGGMKPPQGLSRNVKRAVFILFRGQFQFHSETLTV